MFLVPVKKPAAPHLYPAESRGILPGINLIAYLSMTTATPLQFDNGRIEQAAGRPCRVAALGGNQFGVKWTHQADEIIANIEAGNHYYLCRGDRQTVLVRVGVDKDGKKFLKSQFDDEEPGILVAQPLQWEWS